ncbi:MAG: hypothetical protein HEQ35_15730 [Gloeotrichia echinulata IR180]|jgi:hypothetical protein|nr:hypothetical protein [Gloeotrichia echinulata DEX184]
MTGLNLSNVQFTNNSDVVNPGSEIFNTSSVNTLQGDDQIIGTASINGDFALGAFVEVASQDLNAISSADLSAEATVAIYGIKNQGVINTAKGDDILSGTAEAKISASAETVSQAVAIAQEADATAIARSFASINVTTTAVGIDNSGGAIYTGSGNDGIGSDAIGGISAVAVATVDASAIVEAISEAPTSQGLTAFAEAIATSLAKASITAIGIKNAGGILNTGDDSDTVSATASTNPNPNQFQIASGFAFTNSIPNSQALAQAVANATASVSDKAIAIDNTKGFITTGNGDDSIEAAALASDKAIAIDNTRGLISTGSGDDLIVAYATASESYGIFGGTIDTGNGDDRVIASSFGGGVNIKTREGNDFVEGFGNAKVEGGIGYDTLSLIAYNKDNFQISFGSGNNNTVIFQLDGITMTTTGFEQFNFANNVSYTYNTIV